MAASRWIRISIDFYLSRWVLPLSAEAKLAWIMLLSHVKGHGSSGVCKAIDPTTAARLWFMGEESVRQMLIAAQSGGALAITDGEWTVVKWIQYQGDETAAERMKRYRDKQSQFNSVTGVTRNDTPVTDVTTTETETVIKERETTNVVSPKKKPAKRFEAPTVQDVASYMASRGWANPDKRAEQFVAHYEAQGWKRGKGIQITSWKSCVITWEGRNGFDHKSGKGKVHEDWGAM